MGACSSIHSILSFMRKPKIPNEMKLIFPVVNDKHWHFGTAFHSFMVVFRSMCGEWIEIVSREDYIFVAILLLLAGGFTVSTPNSIALSRSNVV